MLIAISVCALFIALPGAANSAIQLWEKWQKRKRQ
jgi:hypothetical protein